MKLRLSFNTRLRKSAFPPMVRGGQRRLHGGHET